MTLQNQIIGNHTARERLLKDAQNGKLPHAILLTGPKDIGKFQFAKTLAATLLKKEPPFKELDAQLINQERENYIENFQETKLPGFLKLLLKVTPRERPQLMQCRDFFLRLSRQRK